jgi:hypothetical protein
MVLKSSEEERPAPSLTLVESIDGVLRMSPRSHTPASADSQHSFSTIDHTLLLSLVARRISDRRVLKRIRQWLKAAVGEEVCRLYQIFPG